MNHMLETLDSPNGAQGGENPSAESISRKDVSLAWLAGAFEGEGCVFAYFKKQTNQNNRDRMTLTVGASIYNTHPLFIRRVTEILLEIGVGFSAVAGNRKNGDRPGIAVNVQGKGRAKKLFQLLLPYLHSKRSQAELALKLIEYREGLAARSTDRRGVFQNMPLTDDLKIRELCDGIKKAKHDFPSVFEFSRKPNKAFGESSTTLRSPLEMIQ